LACIRAASAASSRVPAVAVTGGYPAKLTGGVVEHRRACFPARSAERSLPPDLRRRVQKARFAARGSAAFTLDLAGAARVPARIVACDRRPGSVF